MQRQQLRPSCVVLDELGAWAADTDKLGKVFIRDMREMGSEGIVTQ